ncbi:unnamed protein product [Effrenium voratum]|nr:unnamed protein product [Effrenium voratum]
MTPSAAGIPLTPEAMLKTLLSPCRGKKATLPRTQLAPEDPEEVAIQRQEAMAHLLKVQLGRPRDEEALSPVSPASASPQEVDEIQEQAMKGALHTLFRSFAG